MNNNFFLSQEYSGYVFSEGTLNVDHLLTNAKQFLECIKPTLLNNGSFSVERYKQLLRILNVLNNNLERTDFTDEDKCNLWDEICDFLNEIAPEGHTFSSHEGDGACFGFWGNYEDEDYCCVMEKQFLQDDADTQHVKHKQFLSDVKKLVDYNYDEEFKHMTELESNGQLTSDHIFFTIDKIQKFLEETETSNGTN